MTLVVVFWSSHLKKGLIELERGSQNERGTGHTHTHPFEEKLQPWGLYFEEARGNIID